jgi:hypothetical protein
LKLIGFSFKFQVALALLALVAVALAADGVNGGNVGGVKKANANVEGGDLKTASSFYGLGFGYGGGWGWGVSL